MCGIAGFISKNKTLNSQHVADMTDKIAHRGPDAAGVFYVEEEYANVGIGHRRLSILDLSDTANQPMESHCGRYMMVFNGEVFNYQEIAKNYMPDVEWRTYGDSEVILEAFVRFGIKCIHWFNGMFAIAYYDKQTQSLTLVRDRLGIKPLTYYHKGDNFAFASELKALLALPFDHKENLTALKDYFLLEYIPGSQTIFLDFYQLPAGHYATTGKVGLEINTYWDVIDKVTGEVFVKSEAEYLEELDERFKKSVHYRMISDVPIGAFLSGGTDSSMVCSAFQELSTQPINTFTIGFDVPGFDETVFATDVAAQLQSNHRTYKLSEREAIPLWRESNDFYDQPFAGTSIIPSMLVCKKAKENVTVAMAGDGGDELFFGYGYYEWYDRVARIQKLGGNLGRRATGAAMKVMGGKWTEKSTYFSYPSKHNVGINLWSQEQEMFSEAEISLLFSKVYQHETLSSSWQDLEVLPIDNYSKIAIFDIKNYLAQDLLYKMDIASMASSLEVRLPFLDYSFVEWAINVPTDLKLKSTQKYLPKKYLEKSLTKESIYRKKWGFPAPTNIWFKGELKDRIKEILQTDVGLNQAFIQKLYAEYLASGTHKHGKKIFALVQYINWKEKYGK